MGPLGGIRGAPAARGNLRKPHPQFPRVVCRVAEGPERTHVPAPPLGKTYLAVDHLVDVQPWEKRVGRL